MRRDTPNTPVEGTENTGNDMATITRSKNGQSEHYSTDDHLAGTFGVDELTNLGMTDGPVSPATFTVDAEGWNHWKNVFFLGNNSDNTATVLTDFVHVDIDDSDNDQGRAFTVENAKRGNILLGDGDDTLNLSLATNGDGWSNTFYIDTAAGDDTVKITEGVAQTNAKITDGRFTTTDVTLGDGDDTFTNETKSDDTITTGEGSDTVNYDPSMGGADVITDFDIDSSSDTDTEGDSDTLSFSFGGVDYALNTAQQFADFIVEIEKDGDGDTDAIQDGDDLILAFGNGNKVRLEGVIPMIAIDTGDTNDPSLINETAVGDEKTFFWGDVIDGNGNAPTSPPAALGPFTSSVTTATATFTAGNDMVDGSANPFTETDALAGNDIVTLPSGFTGAFTGNDGDDQITGSADANEISGGAGNDHIDGGDGDDLLRGDIQGGGANPGDGDDTIKGGAGDDLIGGQGGNDDIDGGTGNDRLFGSKGDDTVKGGDGDDEVNGNQGNDVVSGGNGNDTLDGGAGNDTLDGGAGNDTAHGGEGDDTVLGGDGDDLLRGDLEGGGAHHGDGDDIIKGGAGNDIIGGQGGNDDIDGGTGDDRLFGSDGNDTLIGGEGDDVLTGDTGTPKENLVLNPGFEDGGQVGERGNIEKWDEAGKKEGESFEEDIYFRNGSENVLAESVQNDGNIAKLHQTVDLAEGHHYLLSFQVTDRNNDDEADGWKVSLDGAEVVSVLDGGDIDKGAYTTVTAVVTGGAGPEQLQFTGIEDSGDGEGVLLDNVALHKLGANLVENGDFSPPSFFGPAPGWTGNVEAFWEDIYLGNDVKDSGAAESVRGKANQFSNMAQEIEADAGAQLALAVDFAAPRDFDDSSAWTIHWNGEVVDTVTAADLSDPDAFQTFTYTVTSDSDGVNELRFKGGQPDGTPLATGVVLDNVKLVQTSGGADTFEFDVDKDFGDDVITDYEVGVDEVVLTGNDDLELTDLTVANDVNGDALVTSDAFDGSITFAGLDAQTILDNQNDIFVI